VVWGGPASVGLLPEKVSVLNVSKPRRNVSSPRRKRGDLAQQRRRHANVGDKVIILAFAILPQTELAAHQARIIILGEKNRIVSRRHESPEDNIP
jgi:aspartate 1-decarboxylase